ncbi:MAG: hypothetical protein ACRDSS_03535, partial [Actinocrinis sp.]
RVWPRNVAVAVVAAGVAAFALYPRHHDPVPVNATPAGVTAPPASRAAVASPSASPSASNAHPDDQYFTGSPAIDWTGNAAGIVVPPAHSIGHFSAHEIAAGYQGLRQLLIAGNLDATVLDGGPVTDFTRLLDTRSKLGTDLASWIAHPTYQNDPVDLITRFNPGTTRLLGHTVKVSGTMSAAVGKKGYLTVTADYHFVYAVGPVNGDGVPSRTIVRRVYELDLAVPGLFDAQSGRYWVADYNAEIANSACYTYNGFLNPLFGTDDGSPRSGKTLDPYATDSPLLGASPSGPATPVPSGSPACNSVSRT